VSPTGLAFILPLGLNAIEGSEAALLFAASATRSSYGWTTVAAALGLATLVPAGFVLYFLYRFVPDELIDYGVATVIFLLGAREVREGLEERRKSSEGSSQERSKGGRSSGPTWPVYVGMVLEGGEALLYTFAVASSSSSWLAATIGGALGFGLPFHGLTALRRLASRIPSWKQEIGIGLVLMGAAGTLLILRVVGLFGG
jgi:uncharacterized membrane protein